jgi:simple sugar transport system ATP-binding protein
MRRGETLGTREVARGADVQRLAAEIVGGQPPAELAPGSREPGEARLVLRAVASGRALRGVSLEVRSREIVGVAGVLGNGQSELVRVLGGLLEAEGEVRAGSIEVVHEDRQVEGLVLDASVAENFVLGELGRFTRAGLVDDEDVRRTALAWIVRFDVRPPDPDLAARALSGGNQQKIVLGRALAREPEVLVIAHPTRGVDLLAARSIHEQILDAAARGTAVLVISADLGELRLLCDRILVMVRGRVVATFPRTVDDHALGAAMLGGEVAATA